MPDPAPASGNPANAPGAVVSNAPHRGVVAAERARAGRAGTLAAIMSGKLDDAKPSVPPARTGGVQQGPPQPRPEAKPDVPSETQADDETETETPSEAAPDVSRVAPDAETAKRVAAIQAAERRKTETISAKQAELDKRIKAIETEWAPRVKAAEDFEALKAKAGRARSNPAHLAELLGALGYTEDHFDAAGQALYALSKAGQADPARKAQAEKLMRERESASELEATRKRLDELEQKLERRDEEQTFETRRSQFLEHALEAITDETPIAAKAIASIEAARALGTPDGKAKAQRLASKLRSKLWEATMALTEANDGEVPDFADVVAHYEETRGAELDELGISRPTKTDKTPKPNTQTADKQNPARTLSNDLSTPRVPRPAQSGEVARKEHRKESLRLIESGKLD